MWCSCYLGFNCKKLQPYVELCERTFVMYLKNFTLSYRMSNDRSTPRLHLQRDIDFDD